MKTERTHDWLTEFWNKVDAIDVAAAVVVDNAVDVAACLDSSSVATHAISPKIDRSLSKSWSRSKCCQRLTKMLSKVGCDLYKSWPSVVKSRRSALKS